MVDRREIYYLLVALILWVLIWILVVQESPVITKYTIFDTQVYEQQNSTSDDTSYSDQNDTDFTKKTNDTVLTTTVHAKEDVETLIDLHNFKYLIDHEACNNSETVDQHANEQPIAIILVHSATVNWKQRKVLRDTWGRKDARYRLYFLLGATTSIAQQNNIVQENNKFQDIIQGNFRDTYHNLTYKHVMALKWFSDHCPKIKYLIKTDEDVFVNTPGLCNFLKNSAEKQNLIFCYKNDGMEPVRAPSNKWFVSEKEYPGKFYPPYCAGFAIVYSADVVYKLYKEAQRSKYFWIDDVFVTRLVRQSLNLTITSDIKYYWDEQKRANFLRNSVDFFLTSLQPMFLFSGLNLGEKEIRKLWKLVSPNDS